MIKFLPLLFSCLFFFGNGFAQTVQDTLPVPKDTNLARTKQEPAAPDTRVKDSGQHRHDSTKRAPSVRVKAPASAAPALVVDSAARPDSLSRKKDSVPAVRIQPAPVEDGKYLLLWKATLAACPFFNFTGTPVVEREIIHRPDSRDTLFYLLVAILFYFALVRIFYEKYFGHLLTLFFRASIRQQQIREQVIQTPLPSLMLNGLFIITGGLYASYLLRFYQFGGDLNFWLLYLDCMLSLALIYLVKFLILKFCGWVFNISRATDTYIFVVFLVNKMLGIFLLPFLILITFSGPAAREIYVTVSLVMVFVFLAYRILASFRPIRNEIKLTPFHFFLYLCAFEIAPLLLIYKVLLTYLEKGS
ncbi:MAG TPA: DUF4271 domain-containing protein [Puia sp.]|nr:DUF4271 domain-containing protein [Puia sp.]